MPDIEYQEYTLSSGKTVAIRPRTFEEWEKQDDERLAGMEAARLQIADDSAVANLQRLHRTLRTMQLNVCVRDFAAQKAALTLRDIAEIERHIAGLEAEEIPLGNSENGGSGQ